ncbi:MAG: hypothetical protein N3A61_08980 [Ignavibacteria bacterium]|nr:hypothetical protein [Ignavibacteria bacterium]
MKAFIKFFPIFLISLFLAGCLRSYWPAVSMSKAPGVILDTDYGPDKSTLYLGLDYCKAHHNYDYESNHIVRVQLSEVITRKYTNFNGGIFAYSGMYKVSGVNQKYDGWKTFFGAGPQCSFNVNFNIDGFRAGLGFYAASYLELGEYKNFRVNSAEEGVTDSHTNLLNVLFSLYPIFSYEITSDKIVTLQCNLGLPGAISPILSYNNSGDYYWLSLMPYQSENEKGFSFALGAAFNFEKVKGLF